MHEKIWISESESKKELIILGNVVLNSYLLISQRLFILIITNYEFLLFVCFKFESMPKISH
jgi:hypothetical protein